MNNIKKTCCAQIKSAGWSKKICGINAKFDRDGKHYCGTHDPVSVKEREAIRHVMWRSAFEKTKAIAADRNRLIAAAPDLLAALKDAYPFVDNESLRHRIGAVIAKATGDTP